MTTSGDTYLLLRINQAWHEGISEDELYEATRGWWVMSPSRAESVVRVFAVALGVVRAVYVVHTWGMSTRPGEEHRVGFEGSPADDHAGWVGVDVGSLFKKGSANPLLYVEPEPFLDAYAPGADSRRPPVQGVFGAEEPGLEESIEPLLQELDRDLLWSMSRAGQELFHSNTLAFLMGHHPEAALPVRRLFEGEHASGPIKTWRELRHLDVVGESRTGRFVVENKLYSLPYPEQLIKYLEKELPWSAGHGTAGAPGTEYRLLTLMDPTFAMPSPWKPVGYDALVRALSEVPASDFGGDEDLVVRYAGLVRRLVDLKTIVDPRTNLDEPFTVNHLLGKLHLKWFDGPLQRMRFTGLAQRVAEAYGQPRDFGVGLSNNRGMVEYFRPLTKDRSVGWQLQGDALRLVVLCKERHLAGKGVEKKRARAAYAQQNWLDWFDFTAVEDILGPLLDAKGSKPGDWNHYDPDFVYRWRRIAPETSTRQLAEALVALTRRVDEWPVRD